MTNQSNETVMPAETLKALLGSIAKWEGIVAGTEMDRGPDNCPLCQMFWRSTACVGCPVFESTGEPNCGGSPYEKYSEAEKADDDDSEERMYAAAKAELAFLISLLPAGEPATLTALEVTKP